MTFLLILLCYTYAGNGLGTLRSSESRGNQENLEQNREIRVQRREVRKNRETACNTAKTMSAAWE